MAFRMKYWIGLVAVGCALVAIHELPPEAPYFSARPLPTATHRRMETLRTEVQRNQALLQRLRWTDSLSTLLLKDAQGGVAVGGPAWLPERIRHDIRQRLMGEKARLRPADANVLFGYYVQPWNQSAAPDVPTAPLDGPAPETLAGTVDGQPYCITLVLTKGRLVRDGRYVGIFRGAWSAGPMSSTMGACRPFVQFGLPGPRIADWLKKGGIAFAQAATPPAQSDAGMPPWMAAPRPTTWRTLGSPHVLLDGCFSGHEDACLHVALEGLPRTGLPGTAPGNSVDDAVARFVTARTSFYRVGGAHWLSAFGFPSRYLLSDLERQFGPKAFGRFWTSQENVPQAFHDAFGMKMGDWLAQWARANTYHYRSSPSLPRDAAVGGFLLLAVCGAIAGAWATKRSVA